MLNVLKHCRQLRLTPRFYSTAWEEVRIPVPWGHVAGKWWGPQDKRPIVVTHGWMDNCGSFDTLIPLLSNTNSYLAIDLPGCGYSSKLPPGLYYHLIDAVILMRRIVKYFNWHKVTFMGHSMGSMISYVYTMLYPEDVEFLMCLDGFTPLDRGGNLIESMRRKIDNFLKNDYVNSLNEEPPSYSYHELEQKLATNFLHSVDLDKCKYILERNVRPSSKHPNKYYFAMDPRVKVLDILKWSREDLVKNADRLTCPIILIKVDKSPFFTRKDYAIQEIDVIRRNNKNFEIYEFEGTHHLHLNNPERIESVLNRFIKKFDVGNRSESGFIRENLAAQSV